MIRFWHRLHAWPWPRRAALKLGFVLLVTGLCLYPKVWLIPTWGQRLLDPASVLDPDHPDLPALADRVRRDVGENPDPQRVLAAVERVVYEVVPYEWDWNTWGVMDYLPTVGETFEKGVEDCDGRAVVSASLLRHMGYEAHLATDFLHVWVVTPVGETMGPSVGGQTVVQTEDGPQVRWGLRIVRNAVRGTAFGWSVYPLGRELCIAAAVLLALLQPRSGVVRRVAGVLVCLGGFVLLRAYGGAGAEAEAIPPVVWGGLGAVLGGLLLLAWRGRVEVAPSASVDATLNPVD